MVKKEKNKKEEKKEKPLSAVCEKCRSKYTYALADGSIRCRNCGYLKKKGD